MTILRDVAEIAHDAASICGVTMQRKLNEHARDLKHGAARMMFRLAFLKIGIFLIAAGIAFLLWGIYRLLALSINPAVSAVIIGTVILILGLLLCLIIKQSID